VTEAESFQRSRLIPDINTVVTCLAEPGLSWSQGELCMHTAGMAIGSCIGSGPGGCFTGASLARTVVH
jgi:hypothetical protein